MDNQTTDSIATFSNISGADEPSFSAPWQPLQIVQVAACLVGIVSNALISIVCIFDKHLHTPFIVYILLLLLSNFLQVTVFYPMDIISHLYPHWWMGERACDLFNYFIFVFGGILINSHALITFNRLWAITFPVSYRNHHNAKVALLLCLASILYVHLICLPGVVIDALQRAPLSQTHRCLLDFSIQYPWALTSEVLIYILPIVFVVGAYPFLWHKHHQRTHMHVKPDKADSVIHSDVKAGHKKEHSHGFVVLTLVTVGIILSFAPGQIVSLLMLAGVGGDLRQASLVTAVLSLIQPALDPIFFVVCLKDLRHAVIRVMRKCLLRD